MNTTNINDSYIFDELPIIERGLKFLNEDNFNHDFIRIPIFAADLIALGYETDNENINNYHLFLNLISLHESKIEVSNLRRSLIKEIVIKQPNEFRYLLPIVVKYIEKKVLDKIEKDLIKERESKFQQEAKMRLLQFLYKI